MTDFYPEMEKLGPEYAVAFLSEEFFRKYIRPDIKEYHSVIKLERKSYNEYLHVMWTHINAKRAKEITEYVDAVITALEGDKAKSADRSRALVYIQDYIKEHKLVTFFKTL